MCWLNSSSVFHLAYRLSISEGNPVSIFVFVYLKSVISLNFNQKMCSAINFIDNFNVYILFFFICLTIFLEGGIGGGVFTYDYLWVSFTIEF